MRYLFSFTFLTSLFFAVINVAESPKLSAEDFLQNLSCSIETDEAINEGIFKGQTISHLPVIGDLTIENYPIAVPIPNPGPVAIRILNSDSVATPINTSEYSKFMLDAMNAYYEAIDDTPEQAAETSMEYNYMKKVIKSLNSNSINEGSENFKFLKRNLQKYALILETNTDEGSEKTQTSLYETDAFKEINDLIIAQQDQEIGRQIYGNLQLKAYDNFGFSHSTTYNLAGYNIGDFFAAKAVSASESDWGELYVILKKHHEPCYKGVWNLTGNPEILFANTSGQASLKISSIIE